MRHEEMRFYKKVLVAHFDAWMQIVRKLQGDNPNTCVWCGKKTENSLVFCSETVKIEGLTFRKHFTENECAYNWLEAHKDLILEFITK